MTLEIVLYFAIVFIVTELYWKIGLKHVSLNAPNKAVAANVLSLATIALAMAAHKFFTIGEFVRPLVAFLAFVLSIQSIVLVVSLYRAGLPSSKKVRK
jgi:hypothetical protein